MIKTYLALGALVFGVVSTSLTSCSDNDPVLQEEVKPDGEKDPGDKPEPEKPLSPIEMIHAIYDNASIEPQEITSVHQLAIITSVCASLDDCEGPISVTPALLNGEAITLVTLGGTEEKEGQATTMKESQLASFGLPNDYLNAVVQLFKDGSIPSQKPVLITGISLGGMIAQQLLGVQEIMSSFKFRGIITFGSPITLPLDRQGVQVVRFVDENDQVPKMGEMLLRTGFVTGNEMSEEELMLRLDKLDRVEKIRRTSKYTDMMETHALSYIEDDCWTATDFLGDPEKRNKLELLRKMKFYPAPKMTNKKK